MTRSTPDARAWMPGKWIPLGFLLRRRPGRRRPASRAQPLDLAPAFESPPRLRLLLNLLAWSLRREHREQALPAAAPRRQASSAAPDMAAPSAARPGRPTSSPPVGPAVLAFELPRRVVIRRVTRPGIPASSLGSELRPVSAAAGISEPAREPGGRSRPIVTATPKRADAVSTASVAAPTPPSRAQLAQTEADDPDVLAGPSPRPGLAPSPLLASPLPPPLATPVLGRRQPQAAVMDVRLPVAASLETTSPGSRPGPASSDGSQALSPARPLVSRPSAVAPPLASIPPPSRSLLGRDMTVLLKEVTRIIERQTQLAPPSSPAPSPQPPPRPSPSPPALDAGEIYQLSERVARERAFRQGL